MSKGLDLRLPSYITVRTPTLDRTEWWTSGLPFGAIEELLRIGNTQSVRAICASPNRLGDPQCIDPNLTIHDTLGIIDQSHDSIIEASEMQEPDKSVDMGTMVDTTSELRTSKILDLTALKSVLPKSMIEEGLSCPSVDLASTREPATPQYRHILFSLANNGAGLEEADMGKVLGFLQKPASQGLIQLLRSDSRYSSRAVAQTIFKGAIELGDASLIDLLLNEKSLGIDVNRLWCRVEGNRYTPIERASWLRHEEVIKVLVEHNSDVNRTCPHQQEFEGALDCAIGTFTPYTRVNSQIVRKLLDAGGDVSEYTLIRLIRSGQGEIVGILMSANALKNVAKWGNWGALCPAIRLLDDQTAMGTIRVILDIGADLNFRQERNGDLWREDFCGETVIDAAAQRGSFEMVELLLRSGARLTRSTLVFAVSSGNHHLMQMLLERGADVNSHHKDCLRLARFKTTPLAEAIRLQNPETIGLLQQYDTFRLDDDTQFLAAIVAASEVGNITFIERLIQIGGQARATEMGYALAIAISDGQDEAVTMLIDAGADFNVINPEVGPPLIEAIERHNAGLVHLLLEAGAVTDYDPNARGDTLRRAVRWGDHSIVKSLILAGAEVCGVDNSRGTPLTQAVERHDQALVQLLLDAGADVNSADHGRAAIDYALVKGDISMACYLLKYGADPRDTPRLGKAMVESPEFLELLLKQHRMRHSYFPVKFGCNALIKAIELGDENAIRMMLERGLDANSLTPIVYDDGNSPTPTGNSDDACSPFERAIINSTVDVIELFLQKGCNPNSIVFEASRYQDVGYRSTGFLVAISTRNVSKVKLLHRYGADVNFPAHTRVKRTPLQEAAAAGSIDMVELLIRLGAEVNAPAAQRSGGTALQFAAIGGYIPIACLLLNAQADVNAPASRVNGRMALEGAAEHGRLDMLQILLNAGAGNGGRDQGQFTRAIELARDQEFDHIADFLENYLQQNRQKYEPVMPAERFEDDFGMWDAIQQNRQEDEPVMPAERFDDDFGMWDADGGIEGIDMDQLDKWMAESNF